MDPFLHFRFLIFDFKSTLAFCSLLFALCSLAALGSRATVDRRFQLAYELI
jgi:hypothetical protein